VKTSKGFKYLLMCFFVIAVWSVFAFGVAFYGWWMEDATESGSYEKFFSWAANDPAINSSVRINPATSDGIVMLVSGHPTLASDICSEWVLWQTGYPDFLSTERALKSALIPALLGVVLILLITVIRFTSQSKVMGN